MNKFFVGQRVRLVRFPRYHHPNVNKANIGDQGTVCGTESQPNLGFHLYRDGEVNLSVKMDRYPRDAMAPDYCFEPILPDGHRAAEESLEELLPFLKEQKVTA